MKTVTDEMLEQLAGSAAYKKGLDYYRQDRVGNLKIRHSAITAQLAGTETWRVTLKHTAKILEGSCDCPASDNFDFCKHCVAVALKYRDSLVEREQLQGSKAADRLPTYLMTLDKKVLVDHLLELIQDDPALRHQWRLRADIAAGKINDKAIKKQLTAAIPYNRHLHRYAQVRQYFQRLEGVLENLGPLIEQQPPETAMALVDYAVERIDRALETVDDSGGFRYSSLEQLADLHRQTLARSGLGPEQIADYLIELYKQPKADFYPEIPSGYSELLGEAGMKCFYQRLRDAWDALPPLARKDRQQESTYLHLMIPLLEAARDRGDVGAEVELRSKMATDFDDFLRLSGLCLEAGQLDQALWWRKRAEKAGGKPYDAEDELEDNQLAIWLFQKDYAPVLAVLWRRFTKMPNLDNYQQIVDIPSPESGPDYPARAMALLQQIIDSNKSEMQRRLAINTLAEIYLDQQQPRQALALAEKAKIDPDLLLVIADANRDQPARALPLVFRFAEFSVKQTSNRDYEAAVEALTMAREIAGEKHRDDFRGRLEDLHLEHKRKRNFCQMLGKEFGDLS